MTEVDSQLSDELEQAALDGLKERATKLGIKFHPNIKADALREKIAAANAETGTVTVKAQTASPESQAQQLRMEASKLIRIKLSCMNPSKKEWEGEILTVGNSVVGTHKKYIPFNADEGWHVPKIIYDALVERQCQVFTTVKDSRGNNVRKGKLIKEFAIEVLPQLTEAELKEMARRQAMSRAID
jgi:hypothetical protein